MIFLADLPPGGSPLVVPLAILALVIGLVVWGVLRARRKPPTLSGESDAQLESSAPPAVDVLADRAEVRGPVKITESMSLREVKEAKRAYLSDEFKTSDAVTLEKERRKGKVLDAPEAAEVPEAAAADDATAPRADAHAPATPAALPAAPSVAEGAPPPSATTDRASLPAPAPTSAPVTTPAPVATAPTPAEPPRAVRPAPAIDGGRSMRDGLERTRSGFMGRLGAIFSKAELNDDLLEQIEEVLFTADVGVKTSNRLLEAIRTRYASGEITDTKGVWAALRAEAASILQSNARSLDIESRPGPVVLMMVGVNGAGKTTTIGKLAARYSARGKKVLLVAGDTFRAAAVDQLVEWANRVDVPCHTGAEGAEPSGVIFDGLQRAKAEGFDVVICDTAGRLQTKKPLMDELSKIARSAAKAVPGAPHETILVLDSNTGQNAIQQARLFGEATPLTGIVLTKLDGTAKGGVVLGISDEMRLPIYFVGIGEAVADLRPFEPSEFVEALF